jgi:hypothetical protein
VVSLVWALDEVFIGFAGWPVAVVRRELEAACELYDCRLDQDTLDVFAREIAAGRERVESDAGTIRCGRMGRLSWTGVRCRFHGVQLARVVLVRRRLVVRSR